MLQQLIFNVLNLLKHFFKFVSLEKAEMQNENTTFTPKRLQHYFYTFVKLTFQEGLYRIYPNKRPGSKVTHFF